MNAVLKISIWGFLIFSISCVSEPKIENIYIGKTVKISSLMVPTDSEIFTYYWQFSTKPDSSEAMLLVENDRALFTPDRTGNYSLTCSLINKSNKIISNEIFRFKAIEPPTPPSMTELRNDNQIIDAAEKTEIKPNELPLMQDTSSATFDKMDQIKLPDFSPGKYSLQISSWKTLKAAESQLKKLTDMGIPCRIDQVYFPKSDKIWYRVRVGNFSSFKDAKYAKKVLFDKLKTDLWIDNGTKGN